MDSKKRKEGFTRRHGLLGLLALGAAFLLLCNFDADFLDASAGDMHPPTADQIYEPTYPDDGSASFGIIYAANGPFVVRAFESARRAASAAALRPSVRPSVRAEGARGIGRGAETVPFEELCCSIFEAGAPTPTLDETASLPKPRLIHQGPSTNHTTVATVQPSSNPLRVGCCGNG